MECFAWKLKNGAVYDGETATYLVCLVELAESAGGELLGFMLYRKVMPHWQHGVPVKDRTEMVHLQVETAEEAIRRFWPERGTERGKEFPGFKSALWKPSPSFNCGTVCGKCEQFHSRTWTPVRTPSWAKPRKKRMLQLGNLMQILLAWRTGLRVLHGKAENAQSYAEMEEAKRGIDAANSAIKRTKDEIRYRRRHAREIREGAVQKDLTLRLE